MATKTKKPVKEPELGLEELEAMLKKAREARGITDDAPTPTPLTVYITDADGNEIYAGLVPFKNFKTGSKGYYTNGKGGYEGKRYQIQVQVVEIGSKPNGSDDGT